MNMELRDVLPPADPQRPYPGRPALIGFGQMMTTPPDPSSAMRAAWVRSPGLGPAIGEVKYGLRYDLNAAMGARKFTSPGIEQSPH
jgi:hypothetical protein